MLRGILAKTALERNKYLFLGGILLLITTLLINPITRRSIDCINYRTPLNGTMQLGSKKLAVERVDTETKRQQGLSNRPCIKDNQAMLFVFDSNSNYNNCFWMKDMRFAIDIVWLNNDKKVVYILRDVQPETYPNSFCPGQPSNYVLELKANTALKLGVEVGTSVKL